MAKLTQLDVDRIRYSLRHLDDTTLAQMFNVTPITIKRIILHKTWKQTKGK